MKKRPTKKKTVKSKISNVWDFLSLLVEKSILFPIILIIPIILVLARIPRDDIPTFLNHLLDEFAKYHLIGWALSVLEFFATVFLFRRQRKIMEAEIQRLSQENEDLYNELRKRK